MRSARAKRVAIAVPSQRESGLLREPFFTGRRGRASTNPFLPRRRVGMV